MSFGNFPYRTDLYLFGDIDVVFTNLRGRFGWYQLSRSVIEVGATLLRDLKVNTNIVNWERFKTSSQ